MHEWRQVAQILKREEGTEGSSLVPISEIVLLETDNTAQMLANLNHELIHVFGRVMFDVQSDIQEMDSLRKTKSINLRTQLFGYAGMESNTLAFINEVILETMNIEMLDAYQKQKNGQDYSSRRIGYEQAVIFFDMLIAKIAEMNGETQQKISDNLYRGYFVGDPRALRIIDQSFGKGSLKLLATFSPTASSNQFTELATHFGLDIEVYQKRVKDYEQGKRIRLTTGAELQIPASK